MVAPPLNPQPRTEYQRGRIRVFGKNRRQEHTDRLIMRQTVMHRALTSIAFLAGITATAYPQTPAPTFEVASIKPAAPGARGMFIRNSPGGRLNVTNMTVKDLMVFAYRVQPFQVVGGPSWTASDHYDVAAKPETDPGPNQVPVMLQGLLADRFGLKFHREKREMPVYELVVARGSGKTPGLTESVEGACSPPDPSHGPPQPGEKMPCGMMRMGPNQLNATAQTLGAVTEVLSRLLGRTVTEGTGLTGKYDIQLEWTPDPGQAMQLPPDAPKPTTADAAGPSIFTAIQEQLGLRLESKKGAVEILVIDSAQKPSEN